MLLTLTLKTQSNSRNQMMTTTQSSNKVSKNPNSSISNFRCIQMQTLTRVTTKK